jgi:uncharacterized protein YqeY
MNIKEQIQTDFIIAFKNKNVEGKRTLSSIKAKFQEAEKKTGATDLTLDEYMKVLLNMVKQREQSISEFTKANRDDLVQSEQAELNIINTYLPKKMSIDEVTKNINIIAKDLNIDLSQGMKVIGKIIAEFNKRFSGASDGKTLTEVIKKLMNI